MDKLKLFSVFAVLALLLSAGSGAVMAQLPPGDFLPPRMDRHLGKRINTDYPVGDAAWDLGVRAYDVTQSQNGLLIAFRHIDESRQGVLRLSVGDVSSMELRRSDEVLAATWNRRIGEFTLLDAEERSAHFWIEDLKWVSDDEASWRILEAHESDVELMAAIVLDFSSAGSESKLEGECSECIDASHSNPYSVGCDYSVRIRGWCVGDTRSGACWCAKNDAKAKCTNSACWGCCDWMSQHCDCFCLVGDYFCECGITGFPCEVD